LPGRKFLMRSHFESLNTVLAIMPYCKITNNTLSSA
jgi:hypothetical protein